MEKCQRCGGWKLITVGDKCECHLCLLDKLRQQLSAHYFMLVKECNNNPNPYPVEVFPEISDEDWVKIHAIIKKELGIPLDRISGNLCRMGWDNHKKKVDQNINETFGQN